MTSFTVTITNSYVTALLVQTSLYGLYMATFGLCLRWLLFADGGWKLRRTLDWPMLVATILIFVSNTTWLGANAQLTMESVNGVKLNAYQTYVLGGVTIAGTGVIILVTDAVMIYRCWKVYKKSWRITIPPVLCWLGWLFSLALIFYYNHKSLIVVTPDNYYHMSIHVHAALYSLNAATNIYTTTAIIYRIMNDASEASGRSLKRLHHLCPTNAILLSRPKSNLIL